MPSFVERSVAQASTVRIGRIALWVIAAPFYVLGWLIGAVVVVFVLALGAVKLGIADVRARAESAPLPADDGDD